MIMTLRGCVVHMLHTSTTAHIAKPRHCMITTPIRSRRKHGNSRSLACASVRGSVVLLQLQLTISRHPMTSYPRSKNQDLIPHSRPTSSYNSQLQAGKSHRPQESKQRQNPSSHSSYLLLLIVGITGGTLMFFSSSLASSSPRPRIWPAFGASSLGVAACWRRKAAWRAETLAACTHHNHALVKCR